MGDLLAAAKLAPALLPWFGACIAIGALLKAWQPFKKMSLDREREVTALLTARVASLEAKIAEDTVRASQERERLEDKIDAQRELYEAKLDADRVVREAEMAKLRHRANNADQCLDAFVMLLDAEEDLSPKVRRALAAIKEMRTRQREEHATERTAIQTARIIATGPGTAPPTP